MLILNTPHNPTGKVFTREELEFLGGLCAEHDVKVLSDEVYEHILFAPARHVRPATLPVLADRTVTVSSGGKSFSLTGWKVGWIIAPPALRDAVQRAHQFVTFATASPLQAGDGALRLLQDRGRTGRGRASTEGGTRAGEVTPARPGRGRLATAPCGCYMPRQS